MLFLYELLQLQKMSKAADGFWPLCFSWFESISPGGVGQPELI